MEQSSAFDLIERARNFEDKKLNEGQTKDALVRPFIKALGYDVSDPFEVSAEYTADIKPKQGEKIDYAILHDGVPHILVECKALGYNLENSCPQLKRYFSTLPEAKFAILTDGIRYFFYSDYDQKNIMDNKPFMIIDLLCFDPSNLDKHLLSRLWSLSKEKWNPEKLRNAGKDLRWQRELREELVKELENPSDEFVAHFVRKLSNAPKVVTPKVKETFRPLLQQAAVNYMNERINERLEASKVQPSSVVVEEQMNDDGDSILTTNTEMWGLQIVKTLVRDVVDPSRVFMRDRKTYCGILLDDNHHKPICRFHNFSQWKEGDENIGHNAHVIIFSVGGGERFNLSSVDDLGLCQDKLILAAKQYL